MSTLALQPTDNKPEYTFTFSALGTARFTWPDGTGITLMRQPSTVHAIQTALAMRATQLVQS